MSASTVRTAGVSSGAHLRDGASTVMRRITSFVVRGPPRGRLLHPQVCTRMCADTLTIHSMGVGPTPGMS